MKMTWDGTGGWNSEERAGLFDRLRQSASRRGTDGSSYQPPSRGEDAGRTAQGGEPIEPAGPGKTFGILRVLIFIAAMLWVLASVYRDPMLASAGRFLVVSHPLEKADLVVCLAGSPVERGLEAVELIKEGHASRVFIPREEPPEGLRTIRARGVEYPESGELILDMLVALGLSPGQVIVSDTAAGSTAEEAGLLRDVALAEGHQRLIVVTSPHHSRRAWIAFRHMFKDTGVTVIMRPSRFSGFQPEDWWKQRRYGREVILEYMKTAWYLWAL